MKRQITAVAFGDLSNGADEEAWQTAIGRIEALRQRMDAPLPAVKPLTWDARSKDLPAVRSTAAAMNSKPLSTPPRNTSQPAMCSNW